jgi:hypothetical protein
MASIVHGLLQKARHDAEALPYRYKNEGDKIKVWKLHPVGWVVIGHLLSIEDAEDFLVGKLTQEDR